MPETLTEAEREELSQRREAEAVTRAVEEALRRRYTWMGIIVAIVTFVGSTAIIKAVTSDLQVQIGIGQETLKRIGKQADDADNLAEKAQQKLRSIDQIVEERLRRLDVQIQEKTQDLNELFEARQQSVENLDSTIARLEELSERMDDLTAIVQEIAAESEGSPTTEGLKAQAMAARGRIQEQSSLAEPILETASKVRLSRYSIYVHYVELAPADRDRSYSLGKFLNEAGFVVPDVRSVTPKSRSIRYFHEEDRLGALELQKLSAEFLESIDLSEIELDVRDFTDYSGKMPRPGVIELWLYY